MLQPVLASLCESCIKDLNGDIKAQIVGNIKPLTRSLQRQIDDVKIEIGVLLAALKEQAKEVDSISARYGELLHRRTGNCLSVSI